jgi:hypothetical protein
MKQNKPSNPLKIRFLRSRRQLIEAHHLVALIQKLQLWIRHKPRHRATPELPSAHVHELGQTN